MSLNDPRRYAVVGMGHLGRFHAEKYALIPEARLVAVVDVDAARAREAAARFGCDALTDYRQLAGRIDGASIVVPSVGHFGIARNLLEAGIDVLVEKPIATSLEEADTLIRIAAAKKAILQVGHVERFNQALLALDKTIRNPRFIESHRLGAFSGRATDVDVVLDLMVHDLDIISSIVRSDLVSVEAVGVPVLSENVDIANARVHFENGCIANITASRVSTTPVRKIRIFQPDTYISIDFHESRINLLRIDRSGGAPEISGEEIAIAKGDPLEAEIRAFTRCVETRDRPLVSGEEGRAALAMAEKVRASLEESLAGLGDLP
ncbi:MAG: Gfo/Idh/MocA family protein [Myxococcota bacterium]